jgi:hypothetical protein
MAIKRTKVSNGGAFDGDFWFPHEEPNDNAKENAEKYNNGFNRAKTVVGRLYRSEVFNGEERYTLQPAEIDEKKGKIVALPDARRLLLPDHASLANRFDKREYNKKGEFVGIEKRYVEDGACVEITIRDEKGAVQNGPNKGKEIFLYDVSLIEEG